MRDTYYGTARRDVLPFLPSARGLRVLELGCGTGATGALLKREGIASTVWGAELDAEAARRAEGALDGVESGDVETLALPSSWQADLVLALDVVEHLRDPEGLLRRVIERHLRPGGWLVTCTPNVRYWKVLYDLGVRGEWRYQDSGILDRTHLRFFTRRSVVEMHENLGLTVEEVAAPELSGRRARLDRLSGGRLRELLVGQYVVRSRRAAVG